MNEQGFIATYRNTSGEVAVEFTVESSPTEVSAWKCMAETAILDASEGWELIKLEKVVKQDDK